MRYVQFLNLNHAKGEIVGENEIHQHLIHVRCVKFYILTPNTTGQPADISPQEVTLEVCKKQVDTG